MKQNEPDFSVLECITITKNPRTGLIIDPGGTAQAAGVLPRSGGCRLQPPPRTGSERPRLTGRRT